MARLERPTTTKKLKLKVGQKVILPECDGVCAHERKGVVIEEYEHFYSVWIRTKTGGYRDSVSKYGEPEVRVA